jgi:hypothetical protein
MRERNIKYWTLGIGAAFGLAGILGFIPGVVGHVHPEDYPLTVDNNYGRLLGLFPVNILHSLVHLGLGVWAFFAARDLVSAVRFNRFNTWFYGALAIFGLIPGLNTLFGLVPIFSHDIWLHFGFAAVTFSAVAKRSN